MADVGVIAIGRNEGERLRRCLESVIGRGWTIVYVDSASTDGSPDMARSMGVTVVDLDTSVPFSAARARNAGFDALMREAAHAKYFMTVDGDCEVVDGFIERAVRELEARPEAAVVCGRRRERFPESSLYNRIADVEWNTPIGEARYCGGDAVFRTAPFADVKGYNPTLAAGEEPELCQRLRERGWKIFRIDAEMTIHDSAMTRFSQFWRRNVRNGYGVRDVVERFGHAGLYAAQVRSNRMWAVVLPIAICVLGTAAGLAVALRGWAPLAALTTGFGVTLALLVGLYGLQIARVAVRVRPRVRDWWTAIGYGGCMIASKFAQSVGHRKLMADRRAGRGIRLIEYKAASAESTS